MSANDAKKHFGYRLDTARRPPVAIHKHGRSVTVMVSIEDFEDLLNIKRDLLKTEIQTDRK